MPKRKIKEEKPRKRLGKKELLIAPIAMGASTLIALVIIPLFAPPPDPANVCLKAHDIESFQLYPMVQIFIDGEQKLLSDTLGKNPKDGKDCLRPIHTDEVGEYIHIEYIRPIRFTMNDMVRIYAFDGNTIPVYDNSTGTPERQVYNMTDYNVEYSYFSGEQEGEDKFVKVAELKDFPPFTNEMLAKIEMTSR